MTDDRPEKDGADNIISMKDARDRAARKAEPPKPKPRLPVLLIFLGLLALVVAYKYPSGGR